MSSTVRTTAGARRDSRCSSLGRENAGRRPRLSKRRRKVRQLMVDHSLKARAHEAQPPERRDGGRRASCSDAADQGVCERAARGEGGPFPERAFSAACVVDSRPDAHAASPVGKRQPLAVETCAERKRYEPATEYKSA